MAHHLAVEERDHIAQLSHKGYEQKEIALRMGWSSATICRELKRNRTGHEYFTALAQQTAERRRRERPLTRKLDDLENNEAVRDGLAQNWSPE